MINVKFLQYLVPVDATVVVLLNIIVEAKELTDVIVFDAVLYGVVKDSVKSVLTDALSVAVAFVVSVDMYLHAKFAVVIATVVI